MASRICFYCSRKPGETFKVAPLGVAYIASYLISHGCSAMNVRIVDTVDAILQFKPDVLGISSTSQAINDARYAAKTAKASLGCINVLGGYHVTCTEKLPPEFDCGVIGEGEEVFRRIVFGEVDIQHGHLYKHDKLLDINALPPPFRHRKYSNQESFLTSRGCPYACTFCASSKFWGKTIRYRKPADVVSEMNYLVNQFHPKQVYLLDDLWIADKNRLNEIAKRMISIGLPQKTELFGFVRSNLVDECTIKTLKSIGYRSPRFGIETGSNRLLQIMKGKGISIDDHQRLIDLSHKHGMKACGSFIFGYPGETVNDLKLTENFVIKNRGKLSFAGLYFFNPIPGTTIWDQLEAAGKVDKSFDHSKLVLALDNKFPWDRAKDFYFNEKNVPYNKFREIVNRIIRIR